MRTSPIRCAVAAAATAGALAFSGGPAAAQQTCYPPAAGCVSTTLAPATTRKPAVAPVVIRRDTGGTLARTGAFVVPTALIGVGLVAAGVVLKRSSRRGTTSSAG